MNSFFVLLVIITNGKNIYVDLQSFKKEKECNLAQNAADNKWRKTTHDQYASTCLHQELK